uniref:[Asp6]-bradykinin n=1 Tax=Pelophylax ridibundus TaxID=8406 RepID=BRK3_PELRI|nr:RecName: Full=[Asp6]-bradykinin [Pelophylax ridibundus]
RPPGFDPFR